MDDPLTSFLISQLAYASPTLIVTFAGLILALVFIRKQTASAILTILAVLAFWVTAVGTALAQTYLFRSRMQLGWSPARYGQMSSIIAVSGSLVRALGIALLLAAVFVGRRAKPAVGS